MFSIAPRHTFDLIARYELVRAAHMKDLLMRQRSNPEVVTPQHGPLSAQGKGRHLLRGGPRLLVCHVWARRPMGQLVTPIRQRKGPPEMLSAGDPSLM